MPSRVYASSPIADAADPRMPGRNHDQPEIINLQIPSRLEHLALVDRVTQSLCERMEFDEDTCSQVSMSVIEAGTNAIQHGHKRDPSKVVDIQFRLHADNFEVEVQDYGGGFDPNMVVTDVTAPEHLFDARGRGIFIMRSCMDRVEFDFANGGTRCRLMKQRPARVAAG
jgi:serine/threonine-protein kinase RsbW